MLDLEIITPATDVGTDLVSVATLKQRLRITHSQHDALLADCINEAAADIHGPMSELRRTIFPTTYVRYLSRFPDLKDGRGRVVAIGKGVIPMPLPPLLEVIGIYIEDGSSPTPQVDPSTYTVRTGGIVGEIELNTGEEWPSYSAGPRAISILFRAGYNASNGNYPPALKRYVAQKAAHLYLNPSASLNEPRVLQLNRRVEFSLTELRRTWQVPLDYSDWGE